MPRALRSTHRACIRATMVGPDSILRVALVMTLALILLSWPTCVEPNQWAIGGAGGDFASISWGLWRVADALPGFSPLHTDMLVYPQGSTLLVANPPGSLLVSPVTLLFGPVAAYNVLQASHLILAAVCSWLLLQHLGGRRHLRRVAHLYSHHGSGCSVPTPPTFSANAWRSSLSHFTNATRSLTACSPR